MLLHLKFSQKEQETHVLTRARSKALTSGDFSPTLQVGLGSLDVSSFRLAPMAGLVRIGLTAGDIVICLSSCLGAKGLESETCTCHLHLA